MAGTVINPDTISNPDNTTAPNNVYGKSGEQLGADLHGKFYTHNYRGSLFYASNAPGTPVVIPAFGATSVTGLAIWNTSSTKNAIPVRLNIGAITVASAMNTKGWTYLQNTGSAVGTAAPLSAMAAITATRGSGRTMDAIGVGASVVTVLSTATLTTGATTWSSMGAGFGALAVTSDGPMPVYSYDFDGTVVIQPNSLWWVAGSVADTGTYNITVTWYEAPV